MKRIKSIIAMSILFLLLAACGASSSIVGRWETPGAENMGATTKLVVLEFFSDGTYASNRSNYAGSYSIDGDRLKLEGILVDPLVVTFEIDGDTLIFYDNSGKQVNAYEKVS